MRTDETNEDGMTTITRTPVADLEAATLGERELTVDSLDVRNAVIGDGLMLTKGRDHRWVLHALEGGRAKQVGRFTSAAEALSRLDQLDNEV
jgi:hypothetical protein